MKHKEHMTLEEYMKSPLDRKEDAFGANFLGMSMDEWKKIPESKQLDKIYVKLFNKYGKK